MFLARHTICSSGNARSISAVTPSGLDLPFFQPGQTLPDITCEDVNLLGPIVQRSPPFQNTLVFGLQLQLALSRNSDLKNFSVETSDGRRRRFLPNASVALENVSPHMLPTEKLLVSVEQEIFASATRDDCTVFVQQPSKHIAIAPSDRR